MGKFSNQIHKNIAPSGLWILTWGKSLKAFFKDEWRYGLALNKTGESLVMTVY